MFYTVFDVFMNDFFKLSSCHTLGDKNFPPRKVPLYVKSHPFDRIAPKLALSGHTWYLHEEFISLVLFLPIVQEEKNESM